MPIILDPNALDPQETAKQLTQVDQQVQSARVETPKWFNAALTGSKSRKTGFFNTDNDQLKNFTKRTMNKIGATYEARESLRAMYENQMIDYQTTERKNEGYYTPFARVLTTGVWPSLFSTLSRQPLHSVMNTATLWDAMMVGKLSIALPIDTPLFGLNDTDNWTEITNSNGVKTVVKLIVQSMQLYSAKTASAQAGGKNSFDVAGDAAIFLAVASISDDVNDDATFEINPNGVKPSATTIPLSIFNVHSNARVQFSTLMSTSTGVEWNQLFDEITDHYTRAELADFNPNKSGVINVTSLTQDVMDTISELSVSDALHEQANGVVHTLDEQIKDALTALLDVSKQAVGKPTEDYVNKLVLLALKLSIQIMDHISHKEEALVSTDFLNDIYNTLKSSIISQDSINKVMQESLRLLLSQRLHELEAVETAGQLYEFKPADQQVTQAFMSDTGYSTQQKKIVTTTKPLVIGQAGAGSGKSHTLIGRIKYLEQQQQDMAKVLVLSFTNVAAVNINQRFPGIRSETLANMFNKIYQNTYPNQQLSQPTTVANSLRLLNPETQYFASKGFKADDVRDYIGRFADTLSMLDQSGFKRVNIQEVTKHLANLIQHNMELTEILLDAVEQTTLELQPIIIHHHLMDNHGQLNVPSEYQELNYIITDESQDISTFEYILLLELAIHHSAQLMIVGDGSQTLYEFRNSDPKYMNALESSGVFTTYKLDVNYRSKPEILTFANQFLDIIEANDFAKIQLKSTLFNKPTTASFEDAITIKNVNILSSKPNDYHEALTGVVADSPDFGVWFKEKLDKGEQIAVLGWTRKEVTEVGEAMEQWLKDNNYNIEVTNIMNDKSRPMTVISDTLSAIHKELLQLDPTAHAFRKNVCLLAEEHINRKFRNASDKQKAFFAGTFANAVDQIMNTHHWKVLTQDVSNGRLKPIAAIGHLTREMLRIETRKNSMEAYLQRADEAPDYSQKRILLSTIHGAKGLEFDNTVVLFNEAKRGSTSQESLRMLFVALSRAKKSEFIINGHVNRIHGVSDTLSAMFNTPMETAYMRALNEINAPANAQPNPSPVAP